MSMKAAQTGATIPVETLYRPVERYLTEKEATLPRDIVESFSPIDWAILMSQARHNGLSPRDVVMEILHTGMQNSARISLNLKRKKAAQAARDKANQRPKPALRLVK